MVNSGDLASSQGAGDGYIEDENILPTFSEPYEQPDNP